MAAAAIALANQILAGPFEIGDVCVLWNEDGSLGNEYQYELAADADSSHRLTRDAKKRVIIRESLLTADQCAALRAEAVGRDILPKNKLFMQPFREAKPASAVDVLASAMQKSYKPVNRVGGDQETLRAQRTAVKRTGISKSHKRAPRPPPAYHPPAAVPAVPALGIEGSPPGFPIVALQLQPGQQLWTVDPVSKAWGKGTAMTIRTESSGARTVIIAWNDGPSADFRLPVSVPADSDSVRWVHANSAQTAQPAATAPSPAARSPPPQGSLYNLNGSSSSEDEDEEPHEESAVLMLALAASAIEHAFKNVTDYIVKGAVAQAAEQPLQADGSPDDVSSGDESSGDEIPLHAAARKA